MTAPAQLTVATFNVHCGVDGWGRPFDLAAECAALDADVLVLQESWTPAGGGPSTAAAVGQQLGYQVYEEQLASGRIFPPHPSANHRWGPRPRSASVVFRLDHPRRPPGRNFDRLHPEYALGTFGLAVLTRVPVTHRDVIPLGQLKTDASRRLAIATTVPVGEGSMTVVGTHMSHLLQRSPVQFKRLRAALPDPGDIAAVLTGDMNMWGPPLSVFFPGWRRVIRGRTWPSFRPHSQLDHLLVTPSVAVVDARIAERTGSDHLPVRATLALARPPAPESVGQAGHTGHTGHQAK
ncbi:MAG TPA: endonuclease/exonuclease/phosphatase family protein [Acidimicrobiales bacterium]|nr:endonuclease/exonuclease/phosphatase family protein [Acidimicrobiales bacterium]